MDFKYRILLLMLLLDITVSVSGSTVQYVNVSCLHQNVCALLESEVTLTCSYSNISIHTSFWFSPKHKAKWRNQDDPEDLALDSDYAGRTSYAGTTNFNASLTITDLREKDGGEYRLVLVTEDGRKYISSTAVALSLTDLQVTQEQRKKDLICRTSCSLNPRRIFWYENGQYMSAHQQNHLNSIKIKNQSAYRCSIIGYNHILSPPACFSEDCWNVAYVDRRVCALLGSSVEFTGTYVYPRGPTIKDVFWVSYNQNIYKEPEDLTRNRQFADRVKYFKDKSKSCNLTLKQLIMKDSGEYRLRVITNKDGVFSGRPGVILKVTDLQVRITEGSVASGGAVTLTCSTTCTLPGNPTYIWYKNDQPVTNMPTRYNKLYLKCSTDAGDYSCTVEGREDLRSSARTVRSCSSWNVSDDPESANIFIYVTTGFSIILALVLITVALLFVIRWKRRTKRNASVQRNANREEETYTALNPMTTSPDYDTLANVKGSPSDSSGVSKAATVSSDYENMTARFN